MKHPEVLLLPAMMVSDYLLTVLGARLRDGGYSEHFSVSDYELNPIWQKTIARKRWLNLRHLALTALVGGSMIFTAETSTDPEMLSMALGAMFCAFATVLGRHISNLLIFTYIKRHPAESTGCVQMSNRMTLALSLFQLCVVGFPVGMVAIFCRHPFAIGGALGILVLALVHIIWMVMALLRGRKTSAAPQEQA